MAGHRFGAFTCTPVYKGRQRVSHEFGRRRTKFVLAFPQCDEHKPRPHIGSLDGYFFWWQQAELEKYSPLMMRDRKNNNPANIPNLQVDNDPSCCKGVLFLLFCEISGPTSCLVAIGCLGTGGQLFLESAQTPRRSFYFKVSTLCLRSP